MLDGAAEVFLSRGPRLDSSSDSIRPAEPTSLASSPGLGIVEFIIDGLPDRITIAFEDLHLYRNTQQKVMWCEEKVAGEERCWVPCPTDTRAIEMFDYKCQYALTYVPHRAHIKPLTAANVHPDPSPAAIIATDDSSAVSY